MDFENAQVTTQDDQFLVPHSIEAEEAVLGALLINPNDMPFVQAVVEPNDFFILRNSWVFEAMLTITERGEAIDNLTLAEELRTQGRLEDIGGGGYITYLINNTPTSLHAETYAHIVQRAAMRRRILEFAGDAAQLSNTEDMALPGIMDAITGAWYEIIGRQKTSLFRSQAEVVQTYLDELFERIDGNTEDDTRIQTGLVDLDKRLQGGLLPGQLMTIAGPEKGGKTTLMGQIAVTAADAGKRVAWFSYEMKDQQLLARIITNKSGVSTGDQGNPKIDQDKLDKIVDTAGEVAKQKIMHCDRAEITVTGIRAACRQMHMQEGLDLVIVDYAQLVPTNDIRGNGVSREQEVNHVVLSLKALASTLDVVVVTGSQLNPQGKTRESKSFGMHSDILLTIKLPKGMTEGHAPGNRTFYVLQRSGPSGPVEVVYRPSRLEFGNSAHAQDANQNE